MCVVEILMQIATNVNQAHSMVGVCHCTYFIHVHVSTFNHDSEVCSFNHDSEVCSFNHDFKVFK